MGGGGSLGNEEQLFTTRAGSEFVRAGCTLPAPVPAPEFGETPPSEAGSVLLLLAGAEPAADGGGPLLDGVGAEAGGTEAAVLSPCPTSVLHRGLPVPMGGGKKSLRVRQPNMTPVVGGPAPADAGGAPVLGRGRGGVGVPKKRRRLAVQTPHTNSACLGYLLYKVRHSLG